MNRWSWYCKTILYKWSHPEFWPMWTYYIPMIPLWVFFLIKTRQTKLYRYINPGIRNGGLHDVSKWEIYQMLPSSKIPKTVLFSKGSDLNLILNSHSIDFPFIAKPDKGFRGIGVAKISNETEWIQYVESMQSPILIQAFIDKPMEVGIFYRRMPQEENGTITGITTKQLMKIRGDGVKTIECLLQENPRYSLQLNRLKKQVDVSFVLPKGEEMMVEPIGNHNRGTLFEDGQSYITTALVNRIDNLAKSIPGFYYGRFDIKCQSWENLTEQDDYTIIELNGALSEPTQMYDPNVGYWRAVKMLWKSHQEMLEIANMNFMLSKKKDN